MTGALASAPRARGFITMGVADENERERIYALRHEVYARELGQHHVRPEARLHDALDDRNVYLVARVDGELAGFISVTPPGGAFSIDKYFEPGSLALPRGPGLFEIRLLTVVGPRRGSTLAPLLMYAALRWAEERGATTLVALGREEMLGIYHRVGLRPLGPVVQSGAVRYHLLHASVSAVHAATTALGGMLPRIEREVRWEIPAPPRTAPACYHGGAFFDAIGDEFDTLERFETVISADVLDAWFPPSPRVLRALAESLPWLVRTSPPTSCEGLVRTIARVRGVDAACVLPGGGSSDLIFLALTRWLTPRSRVLILDPSYGEYSHVLEKVIGCRLDRLVLSPVENFDVNLSELLERSRDVAYDLVILVNPNSPTGRHVSRRALEPVIAEIARTTRVWIDETYVDYVGAAESLERFACTHDRVVVCKSMSKVYALSGVRVAYLCSSPAAIAELVPYTPPWAVSLPGQVAAVNALQDGAYYSDRWRETHALREQLALALRAMGIHVTDGVANFLLCELPHDGPDAATVVARCRLHGLFLRAMDTMGPSLGAHAIRFAVKDAETNARMLAIFEPCLRGVPEPPAVAACQLASLPPSGLDCASCGPPRS